MILSSWFSLLYKCSGLSLTQPGFTPLHQQEMACDQQVRNTHVFVLSGTLISPQSKITEMTHPVREKFYLSSYLDL